MSWPSPLWHRQVFYFIFFFLVVPTECVFYVTFQSHRTSSPYIHLDFGMITAPSFPLLPLWGLRPCLQSARDVYFGLLTLRSCASHNDLPQNRNSLAFFPSFRFIVVNLPSLYLGFEGIFLPFPHHDYGRLKTKEGWCMFLTMSWLWWQWKDKSV